MQGGGGCRAKGRKRGVGTRARQCTAQRLWLARPESARQSTVGSQGSRQGSLGRTGRNRPGDSWSLLRVGLGASFLFVPCAHTSLWVVHRQPGRRRREAHILGGITGFPAWSVGS